MDPATIAAIYLGASSLIGSFFTSSAASDAAGAQLQAANNALAFEEQVYNQNHADQAPWLASGQAAILKMAKLAGLGDITPNTAAAVSTVNPGGGLTQSPLGPGDPTGGAGYASGGSGGPAPGFGIGFGPGNGADLASSPGPLGGAPGSANEFFSGNPGGAFFGGNVPGSGSDQTYPSQPGRRAQAYGMTRSLADIGTSADPNASGNVTVTDPNGGIHRFPSQIEAQAFRKAIGASA